MEVCCPQAGNGKCWVLQRRRDISGNVKNRKLPVGIQSFEKMIDQHNLYVDKTDYIFKLVHTDAPYFLSRPRRFGKSLLSTIKAYREGKKELFQGLKIETLEKDNPDAWQPYPVFSFDFNRDDYTEMAALEGILDAHLSRWENTYAVYPSDSQSLAVRFPNLVLAANDQTGKRCVILVDEYDKPLLDVMENDDLLKHNRKVLKGFFSTLKSFDEYIQFICITGVTKFSKVSIFSDLNQLVDISLDDDFSAICGITEEELVENFDLEIARMAKERSLTREECLERLKSIYDGYCFSAHGKAVYNPAFCPHC